MFICHHGFVPTSQELICPKCFAESAQNAMVSIGTSTNKSKVAIALLNDMESAVNSGIVYDWSSSFKDIVSKWRSAKATIC